MDTNVVYCGDAINVLQTLPDNSIDMILTSPPYYMQRKYKSGEKEIGWGSVEDYVQALGEIFQEGLRVLSPSGSMYLNIGGKQNTKTGDWLPTPWLVAMDLIKRGWKLKSDIIYSKINGTPASYKNRPVNSHEYVFLMTKRSKDYYYDWESIATQPADSTMKDKRPKGVMRQRVNKKSKYHENCDEVIAGQYRKQDEVGRSDYTGFNDRYTPVDKVRRRDVWRMTVLGSPIKHFAMMNPKLAELCILAGCPKDGVVLDPFCGVNTTGLVAKSLNRNYIGIDLNPKYVEMATDYLNTHIYDPINKKVIKNHS